MQADDLYGLPLERFVPERGELVKALRADGRREEAGAVAKLRKPTVAAWAVNQLVRTQRRAVAELFEAGDSLRAAHGELLSGRGDARELRAAADRERAAVASLVEAARGLLSSEGHELSEATIDRVADTLHAAALDDAGREKVRDGRLERELSHVGLGMAVVPPPAAKRRPTRATGRSTSAEAVRAARAAEASARRRAERAARALGAAEARRDRAADSLRAAEEAVQQARADAKAAADELRRAQREAGRTKG
jgi:hypothetical protein